MCRRCCVLVFALRGYGARVFVVKCEPFCAAIESIATEMDNSVSSCIFPLIVSVRSFMNPVLPQLDLLKCRKESMSYKNEVRI